MKRARRVTWLAVVWLVALLGNSMPVAAEGQTYATEGECMNSTKMLCEQDSTGRWFATDQPGNYTEHDPVVAERMRRTMPFNVSGTSDSPVVVVDFEKVAFPDVQPYLDPIDNRVRVPIRFVSERLGAGVTWDQATKTVTLQRDNLNIQLTVGSHHVIINGGGVLTQDAPPRLENDRVMVPLRLISEVFGAQVDWVGKEPPLNVEMYSGRYQVWIWVPWGFWGKIGLDRRLTEYAYLRP